MTWRNTLTAGLLAFAVSACGTTPPTRYLTLTAVPPTGPRDLTGQGLVLIPPTVQWPAAFDRLEVTQPGRDVEVTVEALTRWSAAPGRLASAALTEDLAARLPGLTLAPWPGPDVPGAATVDVQVEAIDARPDGYGLLALVTITRGPERPRHRLIALQAAGVHSADGEARAMSRLIAALADQLAGDLSADVSVDQTSQNASRRPTP
jgi:uncharacterized protein